MHYLDLRNYNNWIGQSPKMIQSEVVKAGGWAKVFPQNQILPKWASRVRNYFNEYPTQMMLLSSRRGHNLEHNVNNYRQFDGLNSLFTQFALSGDVYFDQTKRLWYEMDTAGAGYHFEHRNIIEKSHPIVKGIKGKVTPQSQIPVFKLISPDGTGGSLEVCIHNFQVYNSVWQALNPFTGGTGGKTSIGGVNKWVSVRSLIVGNEILKGSYNYAETVVRGYDAHKHSDIIPHSGQKHFYVDPPKWSKIESRVFPSNDRQNRLISFQRIQG